MKVVIEAVWDGDAGVWVGHTSDSNPWSHHIATEGRDLEHLRSRLSDLISEFRERGEADGVTFELTVLDLGVPAPGVAAE